MVKWHSAGYLKRTHKFGLELPKMVKNGVAIDKMNRNTLWHDAIYRGMENLKKAFQTIPESENPPNWFHSVNCHMVFNIKMKDLWKKACLVTGGHVTHTLSCAN